MKTANKIVSLALSWQGKNESNGTHKEIIDIYNNHKPLARGYKVKYTDSWCATFISALSIKLGYTNIIPTECSCLKMIELFKKLGTYIENENYTPKIGDIVFYDWQDNGKGDNKGTPDHVGIVVDVSRETFMVIEGNYQNAVKERVMQINGRYLRGFATPNYDVSNGSEKVADVSETSDAIKKLAYEVIKGKWGNGSERYERINNALREEVNTLMRN